MRLFEKVKDGGSNSPVDAYFIIECKWLFSIAFLKFNKGGRESYHTHAFNAITWFISGDLTEYDVDGSVYKYKRNLIPKITLKNKNHRVYAKTDSWCLTIRGAWDSTWTEYVSKTNMSTRFTHGRNIKSIHTGILS